MISMRWVKWAMQINLSISFYLKHQGFTLINSHFTVMATVKNITINALIIYYINSPTQSMILIYVYVCQRLRFYLNKWSCRLFQHKGRSNKVKVGGAPITCNCTKIVFSLKQLLCTCDQVSQLLRCQPIITTHYIDPVLDG